MAVSHANCTHPRTPAGRRACRKGGAVTTTESQSWNSRLGRVERAFAESAGLVTPRPVPVRAPRDVPRLPVKPARIQPRRSGARVSATSSTCVQAALHVDAHGGRCACGWEAVAA